MMGKKRRMHAPFLVMTGILAGTGSASTPCFNLLQGFVTDMFHRRTDPLDTTGGTVIRVLDDGLQTVAAGFDLLQIR
jgi:hypothetical protein